MAKKHTNKPKTKGLIKEGDRKGERGGGGGGADGGAMLYTDILYATLTMSLLKFRNHLCLLHQ